jgi:hypothetical protein
MMIRGVPAELDHAIGRPSGGCQAVWISTPAGVEMLITLAGGIADEAAAERIWRFLRTPHPGQGRVGPYARADMPFPLVAYVNSDVIVLSTRLTAEELRRIAKVTRRSWYAGVAARGGWDLDQTPGSPRPSPNRTC